MKGRVVELGHIVAGPCAGLILADFGFEVIKIERPGSGDISRTLSGQSSGAFPFYNRNKKSLSLDISAEKGKEVFSKLVKVSDIIIDNLGPGSVAKYGFSYDKIKELNDRIIYVSLKGYGSGPYENRKSLDYPIEVHSGLAYMNGLKGRPMRVGASIIDMSAAMFGVMGVLNALLEREKSGKGQHIDVGMFETAAFFMGQHIASYQNEGRELQPINEEGFAWGIYDFFRTSDGIEIFIAVTTDPQWSKFCEAFSLDICSNKDYDTNLARFSRRDILIPLITKRIDSMASDAVIQILVRENISYALLNKPSDLLNDPHLSRKMIRIKYGGEYLSVPETPIGSVKGSNPPQLGEHDKEILTALGYTKEEIEEMRHKGII